MPLFLENNAVVLLKQCHCLPKTMRLFLQNNGIVLSFKGSLVRLKAWKISLKADFMVFKLDLMILIKCIKKVTTSFEVITYFLLVVFLTKFYRKQLFYN